MDKNYSIKFTFSGKKEITLQLNGNMTIKEMVNKYAAKADIPVDNFGKNIFLYYQEYILDPNSNVTISSKFRNTDTIYVEEKEENKNSTIYKNNKMIEEKIFLKNNLKNNKFMSQSSVEDEDEDEEDTKDEIKVLLRDMAVLGSIQKQMIESEKKNDPGKFISIDECLNSQDEQLFILGILAKYLEKIGTVAVIENDNSTSIENEKKKVNTLLQFICNGYILKHKYIFDFKLNPNRIKQLKDNRKEKKKFHTFLEGFFSRFFNFNKEDLILTSYEKAKDLYSIIILFKSDFRISKTKEEIKELFNNQKQPDLKCLTDFKEVCIFESIRLNKLMLDKRGNNKKNSSWGYNEERGGKKYYPPVDWWRYGLKVINEYDNGNNDWLSYDNSPGEWCISYRGLSITKNGLEKQYEKEKNTGVYTFTKTEIMEENTEMININGINYKMGLMLRVNPSKIRIPESNNDIWFIEGISDEIRPYGILLKKIN